MSPQPLGMLLAVGREPWRTDAACRGADPWLFDGESAADELEALGYCRRCPVTRQCLEWARTDRKFAGVAGGKVWGRNRKGISPGDRDLSAAPR